MQAFAKLALGLARAQGLFVVLDADALWMVGRDVGLIRGYRRAVVTPNVAEFARLSEQLGVDTGAPAEQRAGLVSRALGGVTVLQKGATDVISVDTTGDAASLEASQLGGADPQREEVEETVEVDVEGGLKRCGGQGDILSGTVGTMLAWAKCYEDGVFGWAPSLLSRWFLLTGITAITRSPRRGFRCSPLSGGVWLRGRRAARRFTRRDAASSRRISFLKSAHRFQR